MTNNDYMNQPIKKDSNNMFQNITDYRTDFDKVLEPKIDPRTDFGKGISYKTCDGKDVSTMEEVMQYNQMFYERMMIKKNQEYSENKGGMHR